MVFPTWGVSMRTRITVIEETYGADGGHIDVVLGHGTLTRHKSSRGISIWKKSGFFNRPAATSIRRIRFRGYFAKLFTNGIFYTARQQP